jgi:hypothetical protein
VLRACESLRADSGSWARGELLPSQARYNATLKALYENAVTEVFCTSIPDYFATWQSPLGRALLDAHGRSRAVVTRIFVFDSVDSVDAEVMKVMEEHEDHPRVSVLVFLDQDDKLVSFPPDLSRDFTMIDQGQVIGITMSFGSQPQAAWYFDDADKKARLNRLREGLIESATPFKEFQKRWALRREGVAVS